ncbi:MAG TPA: nucleotidyltransferase family protein, partial [Novosphingobium sp.]
MRLVSIVLAAGAARRFGSDKLSAPFRGEPLLHHAIRAARAAPVVGVNVVCGPHVAIGEWDSFPSVHPLPIESTCLSDSLKAGIEAIDHGYCHGAFIFLGDMPLVPWNIAHRLLDALGDHFAAVPRHAGKNGHPVLLSARAFPEIARLTGDEGAGRLLKQRGDVAFVDVEEDTILLDVDRAEDLARL